MRKGIVISLAVLLVVFFAIGCTDTGTEEDTNDTVVVPPTDNETQPVENQTTDQEEESEADVVDTTEVEITEDGFNPETIRVMLGDTVTWTNTGEDNQTVTSDDDLFNSSIIGPGETYSYTFDVAGTFDYGSEEDLMASGTVIVEPGEEGQEDTDQITTTNTTRQNNTSTGQDIVVESDQPYTGTNITPNEEDNNTF
jgi:plastocyanin